MSCRIVPIKGKRVKSLLYDRLHEVSNLPEMVHDTVHSPEFKEFFGDFATAGASHSIIVDENGEPAIMYGAGKSFSFDKGSGTPHFINYRGNNGYMTKDGDVNLESDRDAYPISPAKTQAAYLKKYGLEGYETDISTVLEAVASASDGLADLAKRLLPYAKKNNARVTRDVLLPAKIRMRYTDGNDIQINANVIQRSEDQFRHEVMHEIIHALTMKSNNPRFWKQMEQARRAYHAMSDRAYYGFKDQYEFVAEIMTNPDFARELERRSLWDKILNAFKALFGLRVPEVRELQESILSYIREDFVFDPNERIKAVNFEETDTHYMDEDGKSYKRLDERIKQKEKFTIKPFEASDEEVQAILDRFENPRVTYNVLVKHGDAAIKVDMVVEAGGITNYYLFRQTDGAFSTYNTKRETHIDKEMHELEAGVAEAMALLEGNKVSGVYTVVKDYKGRVVTTKPNTRTSKITEYVTPPAGFVSRKRDNASLAMKEIQANIEQRISNIITKASNITTKDKAIRARNIKRLRKLQEILNAAPAGEALSLFMQDSEERLDGAYARIVEADVSLPDVSKLFELATSFDFLNDIQDELNLVGSTEDFGMLIQKLINTRDNIKKVYLNKMRSVHAAQLAKAHSERDIPSDTQVEIDRIEEQIEKLDGATSKIGKMRLKNLKKRLQTLRSLVADRDQEFFEQELKFASSDQSWVDYMFSPLISSGEAVLSNFAKFVKNNLERARNETNEVARNLAAVLPNLSTNPAETFKEHYEEVEVLYGERRNDDGTFTYLTQKQMYLVSPYDFAAYYKAKAKMYDTYNELIQQGKTTQAKALRNKFLKENTKLVDNIEEIVQTQDRLLEDGKITREEYNEFFHNNVLWPTKLTNMYREGALTDDEVTEALRDNLRKSPEKSAKNFFKEPKFPPSTKKVTNQALHDTLVKTYMDAQSKLPASARPGYRLPSIRKGTTDRILDGQAKEAGRDWLKGIYDVVDDTEERERYGSYGDGIIPVYYNSPMNSSDVSLDLASSIMRFYESAARHEALKEMHPHAHGLMNVLENRKVAQQDSGVPILDKFAKKAGLDKHLAKNKGDYAKAHLEAFIDSIFYGNTNVEAKVGSVRVDKIVDSMITFASFTQIGGLNPLLHVNNMLHGKVMNAIEAGSKQFFNKKDLRWAEGEYWKNSTQMASDYTKSFPESRIGQIIAYMDPMQGDFTDHLGRKMGKATARRALGDAWFFGMNIGEHSIAVTSMLALLKSTKFNGKPLYDQITLDESGKIKFPEGSEALLEKTRNRLHAISKRNQGIYNDFDKATIQRHWYGRLLMMYRKFVVPGFKKRFKNVGYDEELGAITEGTYKTMFSTLANDLGGFLRIISPFNPNPEGYSEREIANTRRAAIETAFLMTTMMLAKIMAELDWDDDEFTAYPMYTTLRLSKELGFYLNPFSFTEILDSPTVGYSLIRKVIKLGSQMFSPFEEYERDTGMWEKGDSKLIARFLQLFGVSGYTTNPGYAIEIMQKLGI